MIEMVAVQNPEIRKAANTLYELSADEKVRTEYEARLKAWRDRAWMLDEATESGKEKGLAEGLARGKAEGKAEERQYFLDLLAQGLSVEEIKQRL